MKSLRNLVGLILALALAAFGAPALAQTKIYSLTVPTSTVAAGQTATIVATFKNETPNGNSSFNSIQGLKVTGPLSIIGVSVPNGSVQPSPIPAAGVKSINITSMSPVKNGKTFAVTLTVKADSAVGCTNSSATWMVDNVWTGSDLSGNTFARIPAGSAWPTTTVAGGACSLSFAPAPADALTNQSITSTPFSDIGPSVKVKAVNGSNQPVSGVPVRLEKSGGSCTIASTSYVTTGTDGLAAFPGLASSTVGPCALTATTTQPNVTAASASFNIVAGELKITGLGETVVSPVSVTVSLVNTSTQVVIPAAGTAGLVGTCATVAQTPAPEGTVTFQSLTFPAGVCSLGATGVFAGIEIKSNPLSSSVNVATITTSGLLGCPGSIGVPNTFNGTPSTVPDPNDPAQTAYFAGFRAPDYKNEGCPPVPYTVTNNIGGAGTVLDANGLILGPNTTVINYASSPTIGVLLAHTITFTPERSGLDGLPSALRKTTYCKPANPTVSKDCTDPANLKVALGCNSTLVDKDSIPGSEPGCIRGASWVIVPASDPKCPAAAGANDGPHCIQYQVDILEKQDPPWGRI